MEQVLRLFKEGKSMPTISKELGMPYNTVKSIIYRNRKPEVKDSSVVTISNEEDRSSRKCKCCGEPVKAVEGKKDKLFCSDYCRVKYWRHHHGK